MPQYKVKIRRRRAEDCEIYVEAPTQDEAEEKAESLAEDKDNTIYWDLMDEEFELLSSKEIVVR